MPFASVQLERDGIFHAQCRTLDNHSSHNTSLPETVTTTAPTMTTSVCAGQTAALLRIPFIAQATLILSPLLGWFIDRYGAARGFSVFLVGPCWLGWLLVTITAAMHGKSSIDMLLYLAFALLSIATWMGGLLTVQTGLYFVGKTRGRVIFMLNALFDAGTVTYLGLWAIGDTWNLSLTAVSAGFMCLSVIVLGAGVYFWMVAVPDEEEKGLVVERDSPATEHGPKKEDCLMREQDENKGKDTEEWMDAEQAANTRKQKTSSVTAEWKKPCKILPQATGSTSSLGPSEDSKEQQQLQVSPTAAMLSSSSSNAECPSLVLPLSNLSDRKDDTDSMTKKTNYCIISEQTTWQQLVSAPFLYMCVFYGIHSASSQWNLVTQRDFLAHLGDNADGNRYLTIFTLLMPLSVVAMPIGDVIVQRWGYVVAFHAINGLAMGYSLIKLLCTSLPGQVAGFVMFAVFQSFLYGISFSFLPTFLSNHVAGQAVGMLFLLMGVFGLVGIPLANLAVERFNVNFFIPNCIYASLIVPAVVAAFGIGRSMKFEMAAKTKKGMGMHESRELRCLHELLLTTFSLPY